MMAANNNFKEKTAEKIKKRYPVDERVSAVNEKGLAACGAIAIVYCIVRLLWVGLHGGVPLPELVLLFIMVIAIASVNKANGISEKPVLMGRFLDTEKNTRSTAKRFAMYILDSAVFLAVIAIFDFALNALGLLQDGRLIDGASSCVTFFVVFFLFNAVMYESKVKKYNRLSERLDEEENDLND